MTRRAHPILSLGEALGNRSLAGVLGLFFFLVFGFANLEAIFITHQHADHLADYYNYFLLGGNVTNDSNDKACPRNRHRHATSGCDASR